MKTALKIVLWSLIGISLGIAVWVGIDGSSFSEADKMKLVHEISPIVCLYWIFTVAGIALLSFIYAAITNVVCRPAGWLKTLISVGVVAAVVGVAVALTLCQDVTAADEALMAAHNVSKAGWNLTHIGIYAVCIVAGITVLTVLYSLINGLVQKAINAFNER